jgi:X-X-X-Leu-X-X-Gly heptad repeat protein
MPNKSSPLVQTILEPDTYDSRRLRDIENNYHVEMIAENTSQLRQYHSQSLKLQAAQAVVAMQGFSEVAARQDTTNNILGGMAQDMGAMVGGINRLNDGMDQLNYGVDALNQTASDTLDAMYSLESTISNCFERVSEQMLRQQETLEEIAQLLRVPYEVKAKELRAEADKWLTQGMKNTGRDREEDWKDAMRLLQVCVENPIGMQDYVAWFQIGWLRWKRDKNISEAEEAFYRAQRLSASKADLYHVKSLRHYAYMLYLQDKHQEAYSVIQKAVAISNEHDTIFDAARYAAKTGRGEEALAHLERCILERPTTIVTMFAEADFQ